METNVDLCFSFIVPSKAMIDDQSFVPVSAYYSCPGITVTCRHRVYLLKYLTNIYCNTRSRRFREYLCEIKIFRETVLACSLGAYIELFY